MQNVNFGIIVWHHQIYLFNIYVRSAFDMTVHNAHQYFTTSFWIELGQVGKIVRNLNWREILLTCRQISVWSVVPNARDKSSFLATCPLETFVNTVCVWRTSSMSFSLCKEKGKIPFGSVPIRGVKLLC